MASSSCTPLEFLVQNKALLLRLDLWKKEEEVFNQRIERKEVRLTNTKNEIYQLLGLYFVFQGVILAALAQASTLSEHNWWIPFTLSLLASFTTILALSYKLSDCSLLQKQIKEEKADAKELYQACDRLMTYGDTYDARDITLQPGFQRKNLGSSASGRITLQRVWDDHMGIYGAALIFILLLFSCIMALSCKIILCDRRKNGRVHNLA